MESFKEAVRRYLKPIEVGKVLYYISLDFQTFQIIIYPDNIKGVLLINLYHADEDGNRLLSIDNNFYREKTKLGGENIFQKFLDAIKLDFHIEDERRFRDECYWMVEKGSFIVKRKNAL